MNVLVSIGQSHGPVISTSIDPTKQNQELSIRPHSSPRFQATAFSKPEDKTQSSHPRDRFILPELMLRPFAALNVLDTVDAIAHPLCSTHDCVIARIAQFEPGIRFHSRATSTESAPRPRSGDF
jgi:hypothetical protein